MGSVRVLYTDIDGTLVGPLGNLFWTGERRLTLEPARAIVAAHEAGLEIVPLTGRSRLLAFEVARLIGAGSWIGELGGVRSYDWGQRVVVDHGSYEGEALFDDLWGVARGLLAEFDGRVEEHTPWNQGRETSVLLRGDVDLDHAGAWLRERGHGWAAIVDNGVIPRAYETLPGVDRVRAYHLAPLGLSKRAALAADRDARGLTPGECAVVGDAFSDLECSAEVGRCFVVANALEKDPALAAALAETPNAEVTGRGHGEGFADAVRMLLA